MVICSTIMKALLTLFVIPLFALIISISVDDVVSAIRNGDATEVAKYFDNTIEITLPDKSASYSKSQAEVVLRDFFTTNVVKAFEVQHKGEKAGSQFCIGSLQTKSGVYRTTFLLKQKGDRQVMQELRFEK